jgi:hypothetical protein
MTQKLSEHDTQFQDINLKFINFEHLSAFGKDDENKGYTNDELSSLVIALEKKITQKFTYVDDRFKKNEDDILKLKQLEKALELTNKNLEGNIVNANANKDNITIIFAKLEDLRTWCKNQNDMTNGQFKDELAKLKTYFEGQIIE